MILMGYKYYLYGGILFFLSLGLLVVYHRRISLSIIAKSILVLYTFLVLSYTIFAREVMVERAYVLSPFWSIKWAILGQKYLWKQIYLNIVMTVPYGLLMPLFVKRIILLKVIVAVTILEFLIEFSQFAFYRGLFETADICCGVIGGLVGYILYGILIRFIWNRIGNKNCI